MRGRTRGGYLVDGDLQGRGRGCRLVGVKGLVLVVLVEIATVVVVLAHLKHRSETTRREHDGARDHRKGGERKEKKNSFPTRQDASEEARKKKKKKTRQLLEETAVRVVVPSQGSSSANATSSPPSGLFNDFLRGGGAGRGGDGVIIRLSAREDAPSRCSNSVLSLRLAKELLFIRGLPGRQKQARQRSMCSSNFRVALPTPERRSKLRRLPICRRRHEKKKRGSLGGRKGQIRREIRDGEDGVPSRLPS